MKRFSFLLIFITVISCQRPNLKLLPYQCIPQNAELILKVNDVNDFITKSESNPITSLVNPEKLKTAFKVLSTTNPKDKVYIAFTESQSTSKQFIILTKYSSDFIAVDSSSLINSKDFKRSKIIERQIDSIPFYFKHYGNVISISDSKELLTDFNADNENLLLSKLIESTNNTSIGSIVFKANTSDYSKLLLVDETINPETEDFIVLDLYLDNESLKYNGVRTINDSVGTYINSFKHTIPQKNKSIGITPESAKSLISLTFDDYTVIKNNLSKLQQVPMDSVSSFLDFTNEIALFENDKLSALMIQSLDSNLMLEAIEDKTILETFRDIAIYEFLKPEYFSSILQPIFSYSDANYLFKYEEFIVFSNSVDSLKSILKDILNKKVLSNSNAFKNINDGLSDEASIFIFKNSEGISKTFDTNLKGYDANALQLIVEDDFTHVNGIIQKYKKRAPQHSITEAFSISLDAAINTPPQSLKNHVSKAFDIAVQDINNTLYLISASGNILWKKQLQGKILGSIEQIDLFKNGRLQLAFATQNRLYVLDRNGKEVAPFPLKFNDPITQPLSVFDYDKNKNYRLLVTQGNALLMYDRQGSKVNGFNYTSLDEPIKTQPKHFRIGNKDYIAFACGDKLQILNRQGSIRIPLKYKFNFSNNELFLYNNKFTTTNSLGQLVQVDSKGKVSKQNLNLPDNHRLETTSKTLVSLTDNTLTIKSRSVDLDYGDYTSPRIYYINDKIYVSVTDRQSKKVYVFDSQAKPIPNFPVFGTSAADLQELDNQKGLELITQADDKTILVYKIN